MFAAGDGASGMHVPRCSAGHEAACMCSALAWRRVAHDCGLNRAINRKAVALYDFDSTPPETDIALKEGAEVGRARCCT